MDNQRLQLVNVQNFKTPKSRRAFSLIEMMVVIAIMGVMMGIVVPISMGALNAKEVFRSAETLVSSINLARSEATAKGTYVALLLNNELNDGVASVDVAIIRSKDRTTNFQEDFEPVTKPQQLKNVQIVKMNELLPELQTKIKQEQENALTTDFMSLPKSTTLTVNRIKYNSMLVFTPQGEVMSLAAAQEDTAPQITQYLIAIRGSKGEVLSNEKNQHIGVIVRGTNASAEIVQP